MLIVSRFLPKQEVSILTIDGITKLNTILKPVDLNSVGTNMVDAEVFKFVVEDIE